MPANEVMFLLCNSLNHAALVILATEGRHDVLEVAASVLGG